tara:strand:+ start:178 stop:1074 length:897 start_codon:yes stop_codon:yes gene_type:complete
LYQIVSLQKSLKNKNFSEASDRLIKYIEISKKISDGKSRMSLGVYDAVNLAASKATTQKEYNDLENVFTELVKMDPNLYKARIWLAKSIIDTNYEKALFHLDKAIELIPAQEDAYREILRIAQNKNDKEIAKKYCDKYKEAQLGGTTPRYYTNYFGGTNLRKMAVEFTPEKENNKFYGHAGIQLNSYQNYEFVPISPVNSNGINIYFSFLPGIKVEIKKITIFHSGKIININKKDYTANSRSAYIDNTGENLSFIIVKEGDEVLYIRFDKLFNSIEKIIIVTKFSKLNFVSNSLCLNN